MQRRSYLRYAFCRWYLILGNVREAAVRAGCPPESAEAEGIKMLSSPVCRRYLQELSAESPVPSRKLVTAGLTRLAFGSVNDVVKLACNEHLSDEALAQLDLFHVTSIKHDKNGFEIKLADRITAMDRLLECADASEADETASELLTALCGDAPAEGVTQLADHAPAFPETAAGAQLVADA